MITATLNKIHSFYICHLVLRGRCGNGCFFHFPVYIYHPKKLTIGDNVKVGPFTTLLAQGSICIESNVLIAANSVISSVGHNLNPSLRQLNTYSPVHIESNCWIGAGSIILQGVKIGQNSIIAAGSLVAKSIPKNVLFKNARISQFRPLG